MKDAAFERWWPLPRSMDLVRGPIETVARALESQVRSFDSNLAVEWVPLGSIDEVFQSVTVMTNVPTTFLALPTRSDWTVLWSNSFLCDGYDSLCSGLTRVHGVETIHWSASDTDGPFQAGTQFAFRPAASGGTVARSVSCSRNDSRWSFYASGEPLAVEVVENYTRRTKRERLNETLLMEMLAELGAEPWRESFYRLREQPVFRVRRLDYAKTISERSVAEVTKRALPTPAAPAGAPADDDEALTGPPAYLIGHTRAPSPDGPASLLGDGAWCGHGEPTMWIHDLATGEADVFTVRIAARDSEVAAVRVSAGGVELFAYDSREHPASVSSGWKTTPRFDAPLVCRACAKALFRVAIGFEVPSDATSNVDTSWFALAVQCAACGHRELAYDDETA